MNCIDRLFCRFPRYRKWRGLPEPMSAETSALMRRALELVHGQATFISAIDRKIEGAEPGASLKFRRPAPYVKVSNG
jgi:hypothetical protein